MRFGKLIFNTEDSRLDMILEDGSFLGGFRCGDRLDILQNNEWIPTRVEYDKDWYLYGLYQSGEIPAGINVRVSV